MRPILLKISEKTSFYKNVFECDVYMFAGITGDFSADRVDERAMQSTKQGGRVAHGALLVGCMSTCSTVMPAKAAAAHRASA
jgi:3-hydroxybutyryl-CoA dehydratase